MLAMQRGKHSRGPLEDPCVPLRQRVTMHEPRDLVGSQSP